MSGSDPVHKAAMEATAHSLAENGYAGLTMRDVAERIDASKSTLHYRYDTKEGLLATWLKYNTANQKELFTKFEDEPPLARLLGILDANLRLIENPAVDGLLPAYLELHTRAAHSEQFREKFRKSEQLYRDELRSCIQEGIEDGTFNKVDPNATARLLIAVPDSAGLSYHTLGDEKVVSQLRTALNQLVLDSLLVQDRDESQLL